MMMVMMMKIIIIMIIINSLFQPGDFSAGFATGEKRPESLKSYYFYTSWLPSSKPISETKNTNDVS